jgi:protein kinase-like protein/PEGA domain-containing protein
MTVVQSHPSSPSPERDLLDGAAREDLRDLFSLESLHRRGPGSIVYLARDLEYDQRVAVKVVARRPGDGPAAEDAFHKAAAAAAVLDHPHIVQLFSAGATDRLFWWSMRYVEGRSLAERLRASGPMELSPCLRIIAQVAAAVESAHRLGVVHGDLTHANVLIDAAGKAHLTDFWVPWVLRHCRTSASSGGRPPGPEIDQAALAALVEACLGKPASQLPAALSRVIVRATSPAVNERFPSVLAFCAALDAATPRSPVTSPLPLLGYEAMGSGSAQATRWRWVPTALLVLVALGAVAAPWLMSSGSLDVAPVATAPADSVAGLAAPGPATPAAPAASAAPVLDPSLIVPPRDSFVSVAPAPRLAANPPSPRPRAASSPSRGPRALATGRLFVNATPWAQVYVDDQLLGNTPQVGVAVMAGAHQLRVVRDGFQSYEVGINVAAGQDLRFTDIVLHELKP